MEREKYISSKSVFKIVWNIISWTFFVFLILVALFLVYVTVSSKLMASRGVDYNPKYSLYTIISPSMEPNLKVYDVIFDKRIDSNKDIQIGDVITFVSTSSASSDKTVTHRVIDIVISDEGKYQYKTKGDNNLSPDSAYAEYDNVLGKVLFKIPQLGRLQLFLSQRGGWILVIVIPALFIIIKDVIKLLKLSKVNKKADDVINETPEEIEAKEAKKNHEKERKEALIEHFKDE